MLTVRDFNLKLISSFLTANVFEALGTKQAATQVEARLRVYKVRFRYMLMRLGYISGSNCHTHDQRVQTKPLATQKILANIRQSTCSVLVIAQYRFDIGYYTITIGCY